MKPHDTKQEHPKHDCPKQHGMAPANLLVDREQRYLSLIYRFLDSQTDALAFRHLLLSRWAEEREDLWKATTSSLGCDFRPLLRLLDRLDRACSRVCKHDDLRLQVLNLRDEYQAAKAGDLDSILSTAPRLPLFERPLPDGWVYPCTLEDMRQQLIRVPEQDLEGLVAVGLTPPKREDRPYNGTYWYWGWRMKTPVIHIYAWPMPLCFRTRQNYSVGEVEQHFAVELMYGMRTERAGRRLICRWEPECLRRYLVQHVLLHEIGHHVQRRQRLRAGFTAFPGHTASEQFADDYASRWGRRGRYYRDVEW